jgi:flagellar hook-associated protein 2
MADLTATGLGSGLDIKSLVDQLVAAERRPANDRLNLAEARVNREISSIGKVKSALAAFKVVLEKVSDLSKFQQRVASVDNEDLLAATATSKAVPGTYSVEILALATRQKIASEAFATADSAVGTGTLTIDVNGESFDVEIDAEANTLLDIRDAINNAGGNSGVAASIVTGIDGAHLVLTSRDAGAGGAFSISASAGGGLEVLDYAIGTPGTYTEIDAAGDASLLVDGFEVASDGNNVTGVIDGITLDLLGAEPGTTVTLTVSLDEQASRDTLAEFVASYNALANTIRKETEFDLENNVRGALLGDSAVRGIQDSLRRELSRVVDDAGLSYATLAEIGIVTTTTGTLEINDARLDAAFAADFDGVGRLFANEGGIGAQLESLVERFLGDSGQIETRQDRLRSRLDVIKEDRDRLDQRIEAVRARLEKQFNAMDQLISQLTTTSQFLAQQLG